VKNALELIQKAAETYKERNAVYGDSYIRHGKIMAEIFPNGVVLQTENDFARFSIFNLMIAKLARYTSNGKFEGHLDSIHDIGVYCFVLEELDFKQVELPRAKPKIGNACEHVYKYPCRQLPEAAWCKTHPLHQCGVMACVNCREVAP
jgi:hypothetical protein